MYLFFLISCHQWVLPYGDIRNHQYQRSFPPKGLSIVFLFTLDSFFVCHSLLLLKTAHSRSYIVASLDSDPSLTQAIVCCFF